MLSLKIAGAFVIQLVADFLFALYLPHESCLHMIVTSLFYKLLLPCQIDTCIGKTVLFGISLINQHHGEIPSIGSLLHLKLEDIKRPWYKRRNSLNSLREWNRETKAERKFPSFRSSGWGFRKHTDICRSTMEAFFFITSWGDSPWWRGPYLTPLYIDSLVFQ